MFLSIRCVAIPPIVSIESVSGVTSRRRISPAPASPASLPPWIDAPIATHSSGLIPLNGSLPVNLLTSSCTANQDGPKHFDMNLTRAKFDELTADLVDRTKVPVQTALEDAGLTAADLDKVLLVGGSTRIIAVMKGRLMFVVIADESSFFAFSAASFNLCIAIFRLKGRYPLPS